MRFTKLAPGVLLLLALSVGTPQAGSDLNEVGALLVYPAVIALDENQPSIYETYITITNASTSPVTAHVAYINGDSVAADYCYECDFSIPLSGNDTEMLILRFDDTGGTVIEGEPDGNAETSFQHSCPHQYGMLVVSLETDGPETITDNVLLGEQTVVNYSDGYAYSMPAVSFQGLFSGDGNREFAFDDVEYGKMPRIVAADFIAPDAPGGELGAELFLFTLNFRRQFEPLVDCSVTGFDADENPFSRSIQFGCWEMFDLLDISPEFAQPNLGLFGQGDTHGWLQLNCETQSAPGAPVANGGVHGAIVQRMEFGATVRRNDDFAPTLEGTAAFGRLLYQSVTTGDPVTLILEEDPNQGSDERDD